MKHLGKLEFILLLGSVVSLLSGLLYAWEFVSVEIFSVIYIIGIICMIISAFFAKDIKINLFGKLFFRIGLAIVMLGIFHEIEVITQPFHTQSRIIGWGMMLITTFIIK